MLLLLLFAQVRVSAQSERTSDVYLRGKNRFYSVSIRLLVWGEGYFGEAFHVAVRGGFKNQC